jgi:hypothetical protein
MTDSEDAVTPARREDDHKWLAMQSAYKEYRRASAALESADQSIHDSPTTELVRLGVLERQQRVAFERYLEARLDFLECRYDEANRPDAAQQDGIRSWFAFGRWILPGLSIMLLCMTALWLIREHKQIRDLEAAHDELRAAWREARKEIQSLAQKQAASELPPPTAVPKTEQTISRPPVARPRSAEARQLRRRPPNPSPFQESGVRTSARTTAAR